MRSYPTSWLQSLMTGVTSKPDPVVLPPTSAPTHVDRVEAEYQTHLAWWDAHSQGRTLEEQQVVLEALAVWREQRLAIARELDGSR